MAVRIVSSRAAAPSAQLWKSPRGRGENNVEWLARNAPREGDPVLLVLVGSRSPVAFRSRVAQAHVRHDMAPSWWSHVMLLGPRADDLGRTPVYEISLEPPRGFGFPAARNGIQEGVLARYRDRKQHPNIAVLAVPVDRPKLLDAMQLYERQRAVLDGLGLIVRWLAFLWGVERSGNPLLDGHGMPSAAMLEVVFGAGGFDLTPGLESRTSCPEAIWQAAKWWHEYYERDGRQGLIGAYSVEHEL